MTSQTADLTPALPKPEDIELPRYSAGLLLTLENYDGNPSTLNRMISETALYYHAKYPAMRETIYYQAIGQKLIQEYPKLTHEGNKPWVSKFKYIFITDESRPAHRMNVNKANLRDLIAMTGLVILLKLDSNRQFFSPCDLEIWWMTSKTYRAPLLHYTKLCASCQTLLWIQTGGYMVVMYFQ